jgi:hypothetical protein
MAGFGESCGWDFQVMHLVGVGSGEVVIHMRISLFCATVVVSFQLNSVVGLQMCRIHDCFLRCYDLVVCGVGMYSRSIPQLHLWHTAPSLIGTLNP